MNGETNLKKSRKRTRKGADGETPTADTKTGAKKKAKRGKTQDVTPEVDID